MDDCEVLECCEAILAFLEDASIPGSPTSVAGSYLIGFEIESMKNMTRVLDKYKKKFNYNLKLIPMCAFTEYVNVWSGYNEFLWGDNAQEFFSYERGRNFFRRIIRDIRRRRNLDLLLIELKN